MKPITTPGHGLLYVIPTLGRPLNMKWAMHFKSINPPINYNVEHMIVFGKPVAEAREEACQAALEKGCKYVFFLGDDVVPLALHTLRQLIFRMETNKHIGVVGGVYCSKSEPATPLVFKENGRGSYWDWKIGEFFEVSGLGMDCTLIRTDVLKEMSKPWFKTVEEDRFDEGINQADQWTEDLYFCRKMIEETSSKVYVDASLICEHWDVYNNKVYNLPAGSPPVIGKIIKGKKLKAVDLGCGELDRANEFPGYDLTRVDIREECNPDYRTDLRLLPFGNEEFDLVFSSHVLEHFSRKEFINVLKEWVRILKPTGKLCFVLPNIEWAIENYQKGLDIRLQTDVMNVLYGAQSNPFDFHQDGLTPLVLVNSLESLGFNDIQVNQEGYNMFVEAKKVLVEEKKKAVTKKITKKVK